MIAVSTYSGECDGLGYAAELAGIEVAAYCESDLKRRTKLSEKHPGKPIFHSDEELTADALHAHGIYPDLLFGGPPCQPFSCAGAQRGTADPRHRWPEMLRLIRECRPRWVLVENVGNFVNLALDLVWSDLEAEGYEVGPVVLPALAVGAPHRRDRCFVVAHAGRVGWGEQEMQGKQPRGTDAERTGENGVADAHNGYRNANETIRTRRNTIGLGSTIMADTDGTRLERWDSGSLPERTSERPAGEDGGLMADTISTRESQPGGMQPEFGGRIIDGGQGMDNPNSRGCDRYNSGNRPRAEPTGRYSKSFWRSVEPRLGRVLDGVSDRLHEVMEVVSKRLDEQMSRWPAWRGQDQYPWEPPRTVKGLPDRPRRIESLGLGVVPWQCYPIFALMRAMDEEIEGRQPHVEI